jgi:hypothetical protein
MIFLFAPALASVAVILAITLRELFTFHEPLPMLDQIAAELTSRHLIETGHRTSDTKRVLVVQASRALVILIEPQDFVARQDRTSVDLI